jgi:hypothetical protein
LGRKRVFIGFLIDFGGMGRKREKTRLSANYANPESFRGNLARIAFSCEALASASLKAPNFAEASAFAWLPPPLRSFRRRSEAMARQVGATRRRAGRRPDTFFEPKECNEETNGIGGKKCGFIGEFADVASAEGKREVILRGSWDVKNGHLHVMKF